MISILKFVGVPGSLTFLALCLALGVVAIYVWPRSRRLGRLWLGAVLMVYLLLALPIVANAIAGRLPAARPVDPRSLTSIEALIVFDGDNRRGRVAEALRVYSAASPAEVWVLGGRWMLDELAASIPSDRLKVDDHSANTREQIAWVQRRVHSEPHRRLAVIASRLQVPRIVALAEMDRLDVMVLPSPIDTEPPTSGLSVLVPRYIALRVSRDAIYELAALVYYRRHGWIR